MDFEKFNKKTIEKVDNKNEVSMSEFIKIYGEDVIRSDKKKVDSLDDIFNRQKNENPELNLNYEEAEKAEKMIPEVMGKILGIEDLESYKTSKYDDYINGVDGYTVLGDIGKVFAYALDYTVTVDDNENTLKKKIGKVKKNISEGHFTTIKYFKTKDFMGTMENIPRLIAPFKIKDIKKIEQFYNNNNFNNIEFDKISLKFIWYLLNQLEAFMDYAEENEKDDLFEKYDSIYESLSTIKNNRQENIDKKVLEEVNRYVNNSPLSKVLSDF